MNLKMNLSTQFKLHASYLSNLRTATASFTSGDYAKAIDEYVICLDYAVQNKLPTLWIKEMLSIAYFATNEMLMGLKLVKEVLTEDPLSISAKHFLSKYLISFSDAKSLEIEGHLNHFVLPKRLFFRKCYEKHYEKGIFAHDLDLSMKCSVALSMKYWTETNDWFESFYKEHKEVIWQNMEASQSFAIDLGCQFKAPFSFEENFRFCQILVKHDPFSIDTINNLDSLHLTLLEDYLGIKKIKPENRFLIPEIINWMISLFPEDEELQALKDVIIPATLNQ
jgi:hypothetical protein